MEELSNILVLSNNHGNNNNGNTNKKNINGNIIVNTSLQFSYHSEIYVSEYQENRNEIYTWMLL